MPKDFSLKFIDFTRIFLKIAHSVLGRTVFQYVVSNIFNFREVVFNQNVCIYFFLCFGFIPQGLLVSVC